MSDHARTRKRLHSGDTVSPMRGRPEGFALRWSAEERDAIKARAAEHGMAVGPFMIAAAMGELPTVQTDRDRRLDDLERRMERVERMQELGA